MPNVVPRGLFARQGGAWKPPSMVWVRRSGAWVQAKYIYAYKNGAWVLIWGASAAAPATATAAWLAPHSVRVTWTPPAINTNTQWIVRRSDGSIAGTVPVGTLTFTDPTPLLNSSATGNKTLGAYTVEGSDGSSSSARVSTNTVTWNLDTATTTTAVTYPTATSTTVTVSWTPNATYGQPDGWKVWRADGTWFPTSGVLPASTTSYAVANQGRGEALNFRVIPMALLADGSYVQAGNDTNTPANTKATTPVSLSLTATSSPLSNLRLTWASGGGSVTGYEVQTSTNGTTWAASSDDTSPSDYSTTVAGYMRVRALSAGGASDWAQAGPVTPINDTTGPVASVIASWEPESSYGRMVVRGRWSASSDAKTGQIYYRNDSGGWATAWGPAAITPGATFGVAAFTSSAGKNAQVIVRTWDAAGNMGTDATDSYTLVASPITVNPSGSLSGTWRTDEWRNDSTRSSTELATGWTSSGHNVGCYFYGTTIAAAIGAKTIVSATIEYYRENEGGMSAATQPLFWTHSLTTRSGTPLPVNAQGVAESARLGTAVARSSPPDSATWSLPAAFIAALKAGTARGLAMYRGYKGSGDPDTYYMLMGIGAQSAGGVVNGQLNFNHLG